MPEVMKREDLIVEAAAKSGFYRNKEEFIREAVRTYLAARKDVRIEIAIELYKEGKISMGRACEIAEYGREELKEELEKRRITIKRGPITKSELKEGAIELLGRSK